MSVLVTGGAGFVGSQLVESLLADGHAVTVVDDLSAGKRAWVPEGAALRVGDLTSRETAERAVTDDCDVIFHLAARSQVNDDDPQSQFRANTAMTHALVAAARTAGVDELVFTSSSTVYGEAPRPTPEDYAPLEPISTYGASKLACEAILSRAAHTTDLTVSVLRFANVVGERLRGAVVPDFIQKLRDDPGRLEILGNGRQEKSYLHVEDCLDAIEHVLKHGTGPVATYNLGTRTTTSVDRIATIVAEELELDPEPTRTYTGGDRGWTGDVPKMRLSIEKLGALGWEPTSSSDQAVRRATRELRAEL
jgi:Nucleoside-diphosphate-sugar epimerases